MTEETRPTLESSTSLTQELDKLQLTTTENEKQSSSSSVIQYRPYESEAQLPALTKLIENDLSEPYSIYTYRYFLHNWPKFCYFVCNKIMFSFFHPFFHFS